MHVSGPRTRLTPHPGLIVTLVTCLGVCCLLVAGCSDATVTVIGGNSSTGSDTPGATATATSPAPTATPDPSRYDGTWVDNVAGPGGTAGELIITNSIPLPVDKQLPKIRTLSVAPLLAEAIRRIHGEESVSNLFI